MASLQLLAQMRMHMDNTPLGIFPRTGEHPLLSDGMISYPLSINLFIQLD